MTVAHATEAQFQTAVVDLARLLGWRVAHFRPAQTRRGTWVTPVAADAAGFPDLVLVRERIVFAELKSQRGRVRDEQVVWLDDLLTAGVEAYLWRPSDWTHIEDVLRLSEPARQAADG